MSDDACEWVVPVFPHEEIPHILGAVLRCLDGFRKSSPQELETSLTKRLLKRLRRDRYLRDRPVWPDRETVLDDEKSDDEGRLDLRFMLLGGCQKPPPYFAVEAKRLHVTFESGWKSLVAEYVSNRQGMMCFIDGRYSKGLRSGGMLGYVFDGDVPRAVSTLSKSLDKHHERLHSEPPYELVPSLDFPPHAVWTTKHLVRERPFTLFHVLTEV